ncbi:hypothetical protein KJZ67_05170 [Patescibacteria group bacterium]|nr:hypothetical protein [Patescibacteria group bacterium]
MGLLERGKQMICYHQGSGGGAGGTEEAAHLADHRKIAKVWRTRLSSMNERDVRRALPLLRHDIANLAATASVTGGNVTEHIQVSVRMVNKLLPARLRILENEISPAI